MARGARRCGPLAWLLPALGAVLLAPRPGFLGGQPLRGPGAREAAAGLSRAAGTATLERTQVDEKVDVQDALLAAIDAKVAEFESKYVVDEEQALADSTFPISAEDLVKATKVFLAYDQGVAAPHMLADSFQFAGPVVGPLNKDEYLNAVSGFDLADAFPDASPEWHHFRADPFEPGRVWMTARGRGTNIGEDKHSPLFSTPTGLSYISPPQACSLKFNSKGQVLRYTIGHVMDKSVGNTGGLGGIYGILYAIGKPLPFPEARPWKMSKRYQIFRKFGKLLQRLKK